MQNDVRGNKKFARSKLTWVFDNIFKVISEVGIYKKRKQENKKKRKKQELDQESDQEKRKFFLVFLIGFLFSYFLVFFYKFPPLVLVIVFRTNKKGFGEQ